jgi:hypothetical protein
MATALTSTPEPSPACRGPRCAPGSSTRTLVPVNTYSRRAHISAGITRKTPFAGIQDIGLDESGDRQPARPAAVGDEEVLSDPDWRQTPLERASEGGRVGERRPVSRGVAD